MSIFKRRGFWIAAVSVLIAGTVVFIWNNSVPDVSSSHQTSMQVTEIVEPVLEPIVGSENVTEHLVRKLAHLVQFAALGFETAALLILLKRMRPVYLANGLFFGMTVALTDESIQILSQRGSQVQDVWLDFAGFSCALLMTAAIRLIIVAISKKYTKNKA